MGKLKRDLFDTTLRHVCPACGQVGLAFSQKKGRSYLARLVRVERTTFGMETLTVGQEDDGQGQYLASKSHPHFLECTKTPAPGVLAVGVRVKVVSGRKIPIGTLGTVAWMGMGQSFGHGQPPTLRVGLRLDDAGPNGQIIYTAAKNVSTLQVPGSGLMEEPALLTDDSGVDAPGCLVDEVL